MMQSIIVDAARELREAEKSGIGCKALRDRYELDDAISYEIQRYNINKKIEKGSRILGRKVGLTSAAIQSWLGVDRPDFGTLLSDMLIQDNGIMDSGTFLNPRAEAEIAFVMGRDLTGTTLNAQDIIQATEYLVPAIEIIDSRIEDWDIRFHDTVADNASSAMFVLGNDPVLLSEIDLRLVGMLLKKKGRIVSTGAGAACLNSPVNAVVWLANMMTSLGTPILEGDIILSGALGPVTPIEKGDFLQAEISGLGGVSFRVV